MALIEIYLRKGDRRSAGEVTKRLLSIHSIGKIQSVLSRLRKDQFSAPISETLLALEFSRKAREMTEQLMEFAKEGGVQID